MKKIDIILCIIEFVLVFACLVLTEIFPIAAPFNTILLSVAAAFSLFGLVYFALRGGKR